ncbi:MAG: hypothetical protein U5R31_12955 [Acidimicrobiia bacterium]|nr:hypothetical protein [Acidimicrobiia bacterium]
MAMTISSVPRALRPAPTILATGEPRAARTEVRAHELEDDRHEEDDPDPHELLGIGQQTEIDPQTGGREEDGREEPQRQRLDVLGHVLVHEPRAVQHDARDERPEDRLDPERLRRHAEKQQGDDGHRERAAEIRPRPPHSPECRVDGRLTDREGDGDEDDQPAEGQAERGERERTRGGQAGEDGQGRASR